jgi:deoxyribodipyrimidine photolyase-related protein
MSVFRNLLRTLQPPPAARQWLWIPYDQLTDQLGMLAALPPQQVGIVLIESRAKSKRRPYHKQKLAFILTNQRHFALEQAKRGVAVDYVHTDGSYADGLRAAIARHGPLKCMTPAERETRRDVQPLVDEKLLVLEEHSGWLTTSGDFDSCRNIDGYRMDAFYRTVRQRTGWLMDKGKPLGGQYSLDGDNREPWRGQPPAPTPPRFEVSDISIEVIEFVNKHYGDHPGVVDALAMSRHPQTAADAHTLWDYAKTHALPSFGPYEDAMSASQPLLFHSSLSAVLHLHRLLPKQVIKDTLDLPIALNSKEGFIRQIAGWREFVRHVHNATDGFTTIEPDKVDALGQSMASALNAHQPLPAAYWTGAPSGLACLDNTVVDVWRDAYSHHIPRLMVLANIATLLDVEPRALTDWFWIAYVDAFDWVVEPNVMAMGSYGVGGVMTTKPYIAGSAYIERMSDHCRGCAFSPKKNCPLTPMYWAFLHRHQSELPGQRMAVPLAASRKRAPSMRARDDAIYQVVRSKLQAGEKLTPADIPPAASEKA